MQGFDDIQVCLCGCVSVVACTEGSSLRLLNYSVKEIIMEDYLCLYLVDGVGPKHVSKAFGDDSNAKKNGAKVKETALSLRLLAGTTFHRALRLTTTTFLLYASYL